MKTVISLLSNSNGTEKSGCHILVTIIISSYAQVKPCGSTFVGTSPEFEVALYSILFLCAPNDTTDLNIAGQDVIITCYKHGLNLGTSFPSCASARRSWFYMHACKTNVEWMNSILLYWVSKLQCNNCAMRFQVIFWCCNVTAVLVNNRKLNVDFFACLCNFT